MEELIGKHVEEIRKILYQITGSKSFSEMDKLIIIEAALAFYIHHLRSEHYE